MNRKYDKDNRMPKAEYARMRRNTRNRIKTRIKAQTAPETAEQFARVLFQAVSSENKELSVAELKSLYLAITALVKDFIASEKDARVEAAHKLKDLFAEYGLSKEQLFAAVKLTRWARLSDEILELEIQKGVDEIEAGYGIVLETEAELKNFFEQIRQKGLRKLKAKRKAEQTIKNNSAQL